MIVGMCGGAGVGKDTAADYLVKNFGFVKVGLADPLKRICKEVFDFSDEQLWGPSQKRNEPDTRYLRFFSAISGDLAGPYPTGPQYLTPRHALQQLGTEWGRACYPNVWVDYAMRVADALRHKSGILRSVHYSYAVKDGLVKTDVPMGPRPRGVVINDVRFRNEVEAIRAAGGIVWRIDRPNYAPPASITQHVSEQEQATLPDDLFAAVLRNDSDLPAFEEKTTETFLLFDKK